MKQRHLLPDLLKGIAVILMIQVHLTELFATREFADSMPGRLSLFLGGFPAAPLFMVVMGWFAFNTKGLKNTAFRAIKLLFTGLLLNLALNLSLLIKVWSGELEVDVWAYLLGADILFLAALSLIAAEGAKRVSNRKWWALLIIALVVATLAPMFSAETPATGIWRYIRPLIADKYAWWSYFPLFPWSAYVLAGMAASALHEQNTTLWNLLKHPVTQVAVVAAFVTGSWYGWQISTHLEAYYHHGLLFFLWALTAIGFWIYLWDKVQHLIPEIRSLQWIGRNVTTIYFVQWVLIGNLGTWLYHTQSGSALVIWFILIVSTTLALVYRLRRLKHTDEELL